MKTERLKIRPITPEDWYSLRMIAADFARSPYAVYDRPLPADDGALQALTRQFAASGLFFGVFLQEVMIGYVCFHEQEGIYDLGYCFHSAYQGQGYAFESCKALMAALPAKGFTAGTALANAPSRRLLEKLGFSLVGTETLSFRPGITFEGGIFNYDQDKDHR